MLTQYGYYSINDLIVIAAVIFVFAYLCKQVIQRIVCAPLNLIFYGLTLLIRSCDKARLITSQRYTELRAAYILDHFSTRLNLRLATLLHCLNDVANGSIVIAFEEQRIFHALQDCIDIMAQYPRSLIDLMGERDDSSNSLAKRTKNVVVEYKKLHSLLANLQSTLSEVLIHQRENSEQMQDIQHSSSGLDKTLNEYAALINSYNQDAINIRQVSILKPLLWHLFWTTAFIVAVMANGLVMYSPLTELVGDHASLTMIPDALSIAIAIILIEVMFGVLTLEAYGLTDWGVIEPTNRRTKILGLVFLGCLTGMAFAEATLVYTRVNDAFYFRDGFSP